jgi:hypothetical protein
MDTSDMVCLMLPRNIFCVSGMFALQDKCWIKNAFYESKKLGINKINK